MKKARHTKKTKTYFWYYLLAVFVLFAISTAGSYFYLKPKVALQSTFIRDLKSQSAKTESVKEEQDLLRLYTYRSEELKDNRGHVQKESLLIAAEDTIKHYMLPYGVSLLDLYMDKNGTVYADFDTALRKKFNGDALEEYQIIAGLYRRIKENVNGFTSIKFLVEGQEVDSFGGHIDISEPIGDAIENTTGRTAEGAI
jgi:hypothetical protein